MQEFARYATHKDPDRGIQCTERANNRLTDMGCSGPNLSQYVEIDALLGASSLAFCNDCASQNAKSYAVSSVSGLASGGVVGRFA